MKRTITISINETVFHIDEDAYEKLHNYLQNIDKHFSSDEGGGEIIMDIKSRIAELFSEKIKGDNRVVTIHHVEEVIGIMGKPEDFTDINMDKEKGEKKEFDRKIKRLYRDTDNRILCGVCSGMAAYFNIDPFIIRILFFVLLIASVGSMILMYILFWIVVPAAKSTSQKLEMKGEDVNIENIKKTIREEFQSVKKNYNQFRQSGSYQKGTKKLNEIGNILASVIVALVKICITIVGIGLITGGVIAMLGIIGIMYFSEFWYGWSYFDFPLFLDNLAVTCSAHMFWLSIWLIVGIPLLALTYLGSKIVFRYKSNSRLIGAIAFIIWLLGIVILFLCLLH